MTQLACRYFEENRCHSCRWLAHDYDTQLATKTASLQRLLAPFVLPQTDWLAPVPSALAHFRNKAKMVVSGSSDAPILGILPEPTNPDSAVDLSACPLYPEAFYPLFPALKHFIRTAGLVPYQPHTRKGELKYILLTESRESGALMLRFVLHSERKLNSIQTHLPSLLALLPAQSIVSANIQPQHAAILEGETEHFFTEQTQIRECFNGIPLFIRPQSFFQTNPQVAEALYREAQEWVKPLPIQRFWDLFCGVGGFGLHCAAVLPHAHLTGIEIAPQAIHAAQTSADALGLTQVQFASLDAANFALTQQNRPDLVIVNPPRRGIGATLCQFLNHELTPDYLLYSSCNAETMAADIARLTNYRLAKVRLFDMFAHSPHFEVLALLVHRSVAK